MLFALFERIFFFNDTATTEIYTLSLHDALPICCLRSWHQIGSVGQPFSGFLENLEKIANSFPGIEKTYAIQAGREIRIFVTPTVIDDLGAIKLAKDVADKIEQELKYPGEIKVNVIRETRAVEYAR